MWGVLGTSKDPLRWPAPLLTVARMRVGTWGAWEAPVGDADELLFPFWGVVILLLKKSG